MYFIPLVLAAPDRHSSWCSHVLCKQHGLSVAAGTEASPDGVKTHVPSDEDCWCTLRETYRHKCKSISICTHLICLSMLWLQNLTFLFGDDERFLWFQRVTVTNRVLCNDPEEILPSWKKSSHGVLAVENTLGDSEPRGSACVPLEYDVMCSIIIINQIWGVIPLQSDGAWDLLFKVKVLWGSRKVWEWQREMSLALNLVFP